jgi:hypothetical protein
MGRRRAHARGGSAKVLLATLAIACGKSVPPPRSLVEDKARRDVPIAICTKTLGPGDVNESGAPRAEAYWRTLVPSFRDFNTTFEAVDCIGGPLDTRAQPVGMVPAHASSSDLTVSPVPDGTQLVWLRSALVSEKTASGLLALVRPRPSQLDVYAIGSYSGSAAHSRFDLANIGAVRIVAARDEGCADVKVDVECESTLSFYVALGGQLASAASTPAERLKYSTLKDVGRVKWRLTTDPPIFAPQAVRVKEKLSIHDAGDNEVRKLEGERIFTFEGGPGLSANADSVWAQVDRH